MEPSFSHSWSLQCVLEGPLASHISSFTKSLEDQGFSQESSHVQTRLVADFSRWLKQTHAALPAITGEHIARYLRYRARHRRRRSSDTCVLKRLLDFLRHQGAIEELPIVSVEAKPYQQLLDKYTVYLQQERVLSAESIDTYVPFARVFLRACFRDRKQIQLASLRAANVIAFVQGQVKCLHLARAKMMVTALRSFLRYLLYCGAVKRDLAAAVPTVANWSMASIPRAISVEHAQAAMSFGVRQARSTVPGYVRVPHRLEAPCRRHVADRVPVAVHRVDEGLPPDKVIVRNHLIGGGFGRRLAVDTIQQAARFGMQVGYPLKIIWTREQDIQHDRFRPAYHDTIAAALGKEGLPIAWTHRTRCSTVRSYYDRKLWPQDRLDPDAVAGAADLPYSIPARRSEWVRQDGPIALNWWRGVGETHNVFVVESFLDELAHAAGQDPVAYRRALLGKNPRSLAVLNKSTQLSGWGKPLPPRCGRGISLHDSFGTHAALVLEVEVDKQGEILLRRATAAVDCGIAVNPHLVIAQIEGGVLFGLSAALYNGITFKNGRVQQSNFHDYRQIRMNEVPPFEVFVMPSEEKPGGLGEVGTVSAAPALANAIFAATGLRLRALPLDRRALGREGLQQS